jgi:hypothetical protein
MNTVNKHRKVNENKSFVVMILLFILSLQFNTFSQEIILKSQKLLRGKSQLVPIYGNLKDLNIQETDITTIKLKFDPRLVHFDTIKTSIHTNQNTFFNEINNFKVSYNALPELSLVEYKFIGINNNYNLNLENDTLFFLNLEALVGNDSLAEISPIELSINDQLIKETKFTSAIYNIGFPIYDIETETVGNFYPNPFGSYTELKVNLVKDSKKCLNCSKK